MSPLQWQGELVFKDKLREFLVVFLPFAALFAVAITAHYYSEYQTERVMIETREMLNVGLARSELNNDLATVISDLKFLSSHLENKAFDSSGRIKRSNVEALLSSFSSQKRLYDQVRLIDMQGQEVIRVNYHGGQADPVAEDALQNKAGRYYFREAIKLKQGEVYISPLDLNMEQGVLEKPLKPVIRFAIPIFSGKVEKRGVLVLNYLAKRILESFVRASANIADHIHLLNQDSYWLHAPDSSDTWGFMLSHNRRFSSDYSEAWSEMQRRATGQIRTGNGLFTFETVTPVSVAAQSIKDTGLAKINIPQNAVRWFIASRVAPGDDAPSPGLFLFRNLPLYLILLFVVVAGSWLLAVTRLKHHRAELESEYERRFRHVLENMELAAVNVDLDARIRFCNDSFLRMTGWQREEILDDDWVGRFVAPERRDYVASVFYDLKYGREFPSEVEAEVVTRDGNRRLIAWHNTLSFDTEGHVSGITAIGEDITEKRQAEAQVRKLSRAVEQSPSIVMLTDRHGWIEYVNPMFTRITGYEMDEVRGMNPRILKSGETSEEGYQQLWATVLSGDVWRGEFHNCRKNGELYWEAASISALKDDEGQITNFIAVKEDITERKRLEEEVEKQHEELARHEALSVLGRMAGMIAHDLRNPLSSVKMTMQILGRHASAEHRELQEIGLGQIRYMENILTDMLVYARPESVKSEWIDISKLLESIITSMQEKMQEQDVSVSTSFETGLPYVNGDPDKLRRLFGNLISNALQALEDSDQQTRNITVDASVLIREEETCVKVVICDNGVGLDGIDTEKIFEPFFTTRAQGTGLGLAIVKQIVDQFKGSIDLKQNDIGETCATVLLPIGTVESE